MSKVLGVNDRELRRNFRSLKEAEKNNCSIELDLDEEKELKQYGEVEVERYGFLFKIENDGAGDYIITMMCPLNRVTFKSQKIKNNLKGVLKCQKN